MREIKFRAWHEREKQWYYFTLSDLVVGRADNTSMRLHLENWCEYTGLKDAKGVEIYEGDILQFEFEGEKVCAGEVKWRTEVAIWAADIGIGLSTIEPEDAWVESAGYEVIGNIYENPELLGVNE